MILPLLMAATLAADAPAAAPPREIADGVHLLPGGFPPGRGPDGNTVVFEAPGGLIVVDTGRHAWHSNAILAFAAARGRPIAAIVNTHWHLDHTSGNGRLKAAYPGARLYTTSAIDGVLAPGGFLERGVEGSRARLAEADVPPIEREEREIYLATMQASDTLRPDVVLDRSRRMRIAGRRLDVRVTDGAVSEADVWLYDPRTRVAVIGDLVTFPAPFFESACPDRWRSALDEVWATPFRTVIPGHGEPMTRDQFGAWRAAYGAFIDCVNSETAAADCAAAWAQGVSQFIADDENALRTAPQMAAYYVAFLRQNGGKSPDCVE